MSEKTSETEAAEAAEPAADKPKPKRKPIYVCVPVEVTPVTLFDEEGFEATVYTVPKEAVPGVPGGTLYAVTRCEGGKGQADAVRETLKNHEIDPTNFDGVIMFRARPVQPKIKIKPQQVIVRF